MQWKASRKCTGEAWSRDRPDSGLAQLQRLPHVDPVALDLVPLPQIRGRDSIALRDGEYRLSALHDMDCGPLGDLRRLDGRTEARHFRRLLADFGIGGLFRGNDRQPWKGLLDGNA